MWVQSSEDETAPIYCDSCKHMIQEQQYSTHWRACRDQLKLPPSRFQRIAQQQDDEEEEEEEEQEEEEGEGEGDETFQCPNCNANVPLGKIEEHMAGCRNFQLLVECSYCSQSVPHDELENHENNCDSNSNRGGRLTNEQTMELLAMLGIGGGAQAAQTGVQLPSNGNSLAALLALSQLANQRGSGQEDPNMELLHNELFPALRKMDKGLKKRELSQFPTQVFKAGAYEQEKCSICMCEFEQGETVMKVECSHIHHESCFKEWLQHNNTCPLCKAVIKAKPK